METSALDGKLVFFALGEHAGGRVVETDEYYEGDNLLEVSFWRWTSPPTLIARIDAAAEDTTEVEWTDAAFSSKGGFTPDAKALQADLDTIVPLGALDLWDVVSVASETAAIDGYSLGEEASKAVRLGRVPQAWYSEIEEEARLEHAAQQEARLASLRARETAFHSCKDETAVACAVNAARTVFTVEPSSGTCTACSSPATLERLDNGDPSGVKVCDPCWSKMIRAAGVYQRYSNSGYFNSFGVLPVGAVPENCCATAR